MTAACFAAIAVAVAVQSPAIDADSVAAFVRDLQREVARDDRAAVAARIQYPLTVFAGGVRIPIRDAPALLQNYDLVFAPALKALIAEATMPAGRRSESGASVAISSNFAAIAVDAVRIEAVESGLKITRITVPLAPAGTGGVASASRGASRGPSARPRPSERPQRLILDVGRIQRTGALGAGERHAFVLSARKNQLLEVRINGVTGRDVVARITSVTRRAPVDARSGEGVRTWIGRIPEEGEYRIDVVRLAPGGATLPYLLIVNMR